MNFTLDLSDQGVQRLNIIFWAKMKITMYEKQIWEFICIQFLLFFKCCLLSLYNSEYTSAKVFVYYLAIVYWYFLDIKNILMSLIYALVNQYMCTTLEIQELKEMQSTCVYTLSICVQMNYYNAHYLTFRICTVGVTQC